mgnify:FL=1
MMKLKQFLALLLVIISIGIYAQLPIPTYVGSQKFSAIGSGASGIPTINFTIPSGVTNKNRIMVITMSGERHNTSGKNFFVNSYPDDFSNAINTWDTYVNGIKAVFANGYHYNIITFTTTPTILQNWKAVAYYYMIPDSVTGTVPITFARLALPQTDNDEMSFIVSVYENVKGFQYLTPPFIPDVSASVTAVTAPSGRTAAEIMYMVNGGTTQETDLSLSAGWILDQANKVTNITTSAPSVSSSEHDGIAHVVGHRNGITGNPNVTISRSETGSVYASNAAFHALIPLASPGISGNVYNDADGPANINGTLTNAGGTYVNVINSNNNLVYSAAVSPGGAFTIPTGYVEEGSAYRLELSENTGVIGAAAPLKVLPTNWGIVGENQTGVSPFVNDGANDGIINLTVAATSITGLRFGITNKPKFNCNTSMYLSQGFPSTTLYRVNTSTNPVTYDPIGVASGIQYNAIGINPVDGYMYGMIIGSNQVIRIYADGTYSNLGAVSGLPASNYWSGEIDEEGNYYLISEFALYKINLTTLTSIKRTLSIGLQNNDSAFNPINGLLYTVRTNGSGSLVSVDPSTGTVTEIGPAASPLIIFGALMASSTGQIYAVANNGEGLYQFNITTGERVRISNAIGSGNNDGAHCVGAPITFEADLYVSKTDIKNNYQPGTTNTYTIVAGSNGPFGVMGATVSDPLPAGIPAANVSYSAVASAGATTNANRGNK